MNPKSLHQIWEENNGRSFKARKVLDAVSSVRVPIGTIVRVSVVEGSSAYLVDEVQAVGSVGELRVSRVHAGLPVWEQI